LVIVANVFSFIFIFVDSLSWQLHAKSINWAGRVDLD